jgi:hypothetical protein
MHSEPQPWKISISDDVQTITVNDKPLSMDHWHAGLQEAAGDISDLIAELSKGSLIPFRVPDDLKDDMTDERMNVSWLNNGPFMEEKDPLLKRYLEIPDGDSIGYEGPDNAFHFYDVNARKFMEKSARLNKLFCFVHNQAHSQAIRISSLVKFRIRNGRRRRNHNRHRGRTYLIIQQTKMSNARQRDEYIPVLMAPSIQVLDETYFVTIRPLEEIIAYALWGPEVMALYQQYMFVQNGERVTCESMYTDFPDMCEHYFGIRLTVKDYRDWAIGAMREYIPPKYHLRQQGDVVGDTMSQHSTQISRRYYAGILGGLPALTTDAKWHFDRFCMLWQNLSGFGCRPPPPPLKLIDEGTAENVAMETVKEMMNEMKGAIQEVKSQVDELRRSLQSAAPPTSIASEGPGTNAILETMQEMMGAVKDLKADMSAMKEKM